MLFKWRFRKQMEWIIGTGPRIFVSNDVFYRVLTSIEKKVRKVHRKLGQIWRKKPELSGCACAQRCYSGHWRPDPNRGPWNFFLAKFESNLSRFLKLQTFLEFSPRCIWGMISSLRSIFFNHHVLRGRLRRVLTGMEDWPKPTGTKL